jgi:hypothetical protein
MATTRAIPSSTEAAIISRMIHPETGDLPNETAKALFRLSLDRSDLDRLHELVVKNQDGALTPAEKADLESYLRISFLVDLMHAKALCSLKKHA